MIRTIAAIAALVAVPAIASAQGYYVDDANNVTVFGQRPDSYSIVINVAGKAPGEVRREIRDAAYTACRRAPSSGNALDDRPFYQQWCVTQAQNDADSQYDRILDAGYGY